jgi:hypothetical protein
MPFIVETGVGIEGANSYCSVEFADGYNATQIDGQDWADVDLPDKQIRLMTASQVIDGNYDFFGRRLNRIQGLEFPRWGLRDRDGYMLPTAPLPRFIKCATAELARVLGQRVDAGGSATTPASASSSSGAVEKIQVGPIALTLASNSSSSGSATSTTSSTVVALVPRSVSSWLLDYGNPRFGYGSARLLR